MIKKWLELIFDHRIALRERMFRVVTGICMIALFFILPMGRSVTNLLILAVSLAAIAVIVKLSIRKECINVGATAIVLLLLLLFPLSFFSAGGFYSGVPEWGVICFVYISLTLEGRRRVVFFLLTVAEIVACYYIAFHALGDVAQHTLNHSFFDSVISVVMVGLLSSVLLLFLNRLYNAENEITQQQKKEIEELKQL